VSSDAPTSGLTKPKFVVVVSAMFYLLCRIGPSFA
jgi:hypothetical protein